MRIVPALVFTSLVAGAFGCSPAPQSSSGALAASADAQRFGIHSYALRDGVVYLVDRDGVEIGHIEATAPADDRRTFNAWFADGTFDDAEIQNRMPNGLFRAPVLAETPLTAALADPALAPTWARLDVRFHPRQGALVRSTEGVEPSVYANTTPCTSPSSDTPAGCARPGNTGVGCTNPSQLPATVLYTVSEDFALVNPNHQTYQACLNNVESDCAAEYGGTASDWVGRTHCDPSAPMSGVCTMDVSENEWISSCPRQTCTIAGRFDAVPRRRGCYHPIYSAVPGSCWKYQGPIGCTLYH